MIEGVLLPTPIIGTAGPNPAPLPISRERDGKGFAGILDAKLASAGVKFSGHALERLKERGINLSAPELQKLQDAVSDVAAKGGKESLIMLGNAALVVSVKNRTVITAFDRRNLEGNIFTNIDSAAVF